MTAELPPRCQQFCPLNTRTDLEMYPIVLRRNCDGPTDARAVSDEGIRLHQDGTVETMLVENAQSLGRLTCTNAGFMESVRALQAAQIES